MKILGLDSSGIVASVAVVEEWYSGSRIYCKLQKNTFADITSNVG